MAMAVVDLGSRRRTLLFMRADQLGALRVVPGVPAPRPLHHRGAAGDAGHPGPRARRGEHRLRRAGQRITLGASAFHRAAARGLPSAGHRRLAGATSRASRTCSPRPRGPGVTGCSARCKTGSIEPGQGRALRRRRSPRSYKQAVAPLRRDRRHRDHRRAAGQFGQAGARPTAMRDGIAQLTWYLGGRSASLSRLLPMLQSHGCGGARGAPVHGDPPRRAAGVDLPVQDFAAPRHPDAADGPRTRRRRPSGSPTRSPRSGTAASRSTGSTSWCCGPA